MMLEITKLLFAFVSLKMTTSLCWLRWSQSRIETSQESVCYIAAFVHQQFEVSTNPQLIYGTKVVKSPLTIGKAFPR